MERTEYETEVREALEELRVHTRNGEAIKRLAADRKLKSLKLDGLTKGR